MGRGQKAVLIVTAIALFAMLLFPPWEIYYRQGVHFGRGYAFLFSPSDTDAVVNVKLLAMQWFAVLFAATVVWSIIGSSKPNRSTD